MTSNVTTTLIDELKAEVAPGAKVRILAFGSSNTERFLPGMHWFDVVELALRDTYGRFHRCFNIGQCGDSSRDLLARFDEEVVAFRPQLTIITIGGNDCSPAKDISPAQFDGNLTELYRRSTDIGSRVIFQTYYAPDPEREGDLTPFHRYMDIVREVANNTGACLIDHLPRWEALQQAQLDRYQPLMHDGFHLNHRGNAVLGLDTARALGAAPAEDTPGYWDDALEIQRYMDGLINTESNRRWNASYLEKNTNV